MSTERKLLLTAIGIGAICLAWVANEELGRMTARNDVRDAQRKEWMAGISRAHTERMEEQDNNVHSDDSQNPDQPREVGYRSFSPDGGRTWTDQRFGPDGRIVYSREGLAP